MKDNTAIMELLADNVNRTTYDFNVRVASKAGLEESESLKIIFNKLHMYRFF